MTISEVSEQYGLSADTLRYYERIGLIPPVNRTSGGVRDYLEEDCRWVNFVKCMRSAGLAIEVIIEYVALFQAGESTVEARKDLLIEQRRVLAEKLETIQATIDRLDGKIDRYEEVMLPAEKKLKPPDEEK